MKYKITTFDDNGNEIITRNYKFGGMLNIQNMGETLCSIIEDSEQYLEEQSVDYKEHEHSDSVDADGTCLQCGATNLI